jgi:hypothetical protein
MLKNAKSLLGLDYSLQERAKRAKIRTQLKTSKYQDVLTVELNNLKVIGIPATGTIKGS